MEKPKKKDAVPMEHWEKRYNPRVEKNTNTEIGAQFNPMPPKKRMTTYVKVNETDT